MTGYVNNVTATGNVRRPRTILMMGDIQLDFERITIHHSGTHQAGIFTAKLPSRAGPAPGQWGWWTALDVVQLDVFTGFPADPENFTTSDLTQLGTFQVDSLQLDVGKNAVMVQGRDLSSLLIDQKTSENFSNMTSSEVAQQFCDTTGLTAQITDTTTKIGTYFSTDYVQIRHNQTLWAILTYLARKEGFDLYVVGRTLYFGNFMNQQGQAYLIQVDPGTPDRPFNSSNAVQLELEHDLTLARDVMVTVKSTNLQSGQTFYAKAKAYSSKIQAVQSLTPILPGPAGDVQNYVYTIPHLTPQQAQQKALELATQISQHEYRIKADLPGDAALYPWVPIEIQGSGTPFDQQFWASDIERDITPTSFRMKVRAKNHPTGTEVALD